MDNIKKQNDILKHQIENEINTNKQLIENNSNTATHNNKDITKGNNKYNHPSSKHKNKKTFLKPEYDNSNTYNDNINTNCIFNNNFNYSLWS